ncbi:MAG: hypothetical protein HKL80_11285 [Acidimicrobiales bacterium]|nr:hypothetical protein [Acidimicrobiales bacterium]
MRSGAQENSAGGGEDFSLVVSPIIGAKEFTFTRDLNDLSGNRQRVLDLKIDVA